MVHFFLWYIFFYGILFSTAHFFYGTLSKINYITYSSKVTICSWQCFWNISTLWLFYQYGSVLHTLKHFFKTFMRYKTIPIDCILIELFIWLLLIYAAVLKLLSFSPIIKVSNLLCSNLHLIHSCVCSVSLDVFKWFIAKYVEIEKFIQKRFML